MPKANRTRGNAQRNVRLTMPDKIRRRRTDWGIAGHRIDAHVTGVCGVHWDLRILGCRISNQGPSWIAVCRNHMIWLKWVCANHRLYRFSVFTWRHVEAQAQCKQAVVVLSSPRVHRAIASVDSIGSNWTTLQCSLNYHLRKLTNWWVGCGRSIW